MFDRPQSVFEHLTELRRRIVWAALTVVIGIVIAMAFSHPIFTWLMSTASSGGMQLKLIQYHFTDSFMTEFRIAIMIGLVLASPFVLFQLVAFVLPALRPNERRLLYIGLPMATGLFAIGWAFGWFVVIPITKNFFYQIATTAGIESTITPTAYIDFVMGICNPLGLAFELPLVVMILARIGLVSAQLLGRIRKFAFLGIMIIAAVLSPPDVISMMIFMVPLYGLYEVSIILAKFAGKKRTPQ
ncbi:MAG TPA: twin-arginine translocase subunit TatC [Symbiobacteriaceae bacterium]|jgi:sec-independent protein translocase protein TatC